MAKSGAVTPDFASLHPGYDRSRNSKPASATSRRGSCAIRPCMPRSAPTSPPSSARSAARWSPPSPPRSPAATATASSSSERDVAERLTFTRVGRHGDGIAETPAGPVYVPYTLPGETAEVEPWPGHPDRGHLVKIDVASPDRIAPICPHFGTCGGCALQHWTAARYRDWKRALVRESLALAGLEAPVDALVDVDVRGSGQLTAARSAELAQVAERHRLARLTRHGELIAQRAAPTVTIGRARVVLPAGAFLQATAAGEAALAKLVAAHCDKAGKIADLFAGVGPFALRLAERARVLAADNDADATAALARAAATTQGLKPIETQARDLFRRPFVPVELKGFDAVVFDPPRQGAQAQARQLAGSAVPLVVAVSCNAATFARDARILVDGGYRLLQVTPVDQFLYSAHVELVGRFER